jgi:hypothetical protein
MADRDDVNLEILTYARGVNTATEEAFAALRPIVAAIAAGRSLSPAQALALVTFCDRVIAQAADARVVLERYGCAVAGVASDKVM